MATRSFVSVNPATGEAIRTWNALSHTELDRRVAAADSAQRQWRETPLSARATLLKRVAARLRDDAERWGELMTQEMGKPLAQAVGEANKCGWVCDYYAENGEGFLAPDVVATDASRSFVRSDPLGVVLAIMPWNFPFWQVLRFGAPALMAGNAMLIKHAPNTFGCGEAIEAIFREAGAPDGLVSSLVVDVDAVEHLIADRRIAAVTLTGSGRAGSAVASLAGRHLKKTVLELGGSDPFIVLADADLDRAVEVGAASRLLNSGQSCIAAKRFLVVEDVADDFLARLTRTLAAQHVGDPLDPNTHVGPLAREDLRANLHRQVVESRGAGAELVLGGALPDGPGFFYPVTLLNAVGPGQPAWNEETFGPLAAVRVVADEREAIEAANDTIYGLGASIWTADTERAVALAARIHAGCVFVNELVKSDPRVPFGGVGASGYGRELGRLGIHEFVNHKTVWVS